MNNFQIKNSALIIVDVQNDFCANGKLAVPNGEQIIPIINNLTPKFDLRIFTQDWHPKNHKSFASNHQGKNTFTKIKTFYGEQILWPDHCIQNTYGAALHKDLVIRNNDPLLRKGTNPEVDSYSGFFENDHITKPRFDNNKTLDQVLKEHKIVNVFICGLAYDFCVAWHALDAVKEGLNVAVIKYATKSIATSTKEGSNTEIETDYRLTQANVHIIRN